MNVIEPERTENLVRADSREAKNGFRYLDETDGIYSYFVPMNGNPCHLLIRRKNKGLGLSIFPDYVLVFNVQFNAAGLIKADKMVEPVDFIVNVETIE